MYRVCVCSNVVYQLMRVQVSKVDDCPPNMHLIDTFLAVKTDQESPQAVKPCPDLSTRSSAPSNEAEEPPIAAAKPQQRGDNAVQETLNKATARLKLDVAPPKSSATPLGHVQGAPAANQASAPSPSRDEDVPASFAFSAEPSPTPQATQKLTKIQKKKALRRRKKGALAEAASNVPDEVSAPALQVRNMSISDVAQLAEWLLSCLGLL